MRKVLSSVAAIVATVAVQSTAHAHFIWAVVEGNQVRFALQENVAEAPNAKFEKYVANLSTRCGGKELGTGVVKDGARYTPLPAGQSVAASQSTVGAKERDGKPYLLVYHAKGAASLAAAGTNMKEPAELRARKEGDSLVVSVWQDEWTVPDAEVWVQWPGEETPTSVRTDLKGEVKVAWSKTATTGHVGLRAMVLETKPGEHEGKKYDTIHHWTTLTFPLDAPKAASHFESSFPSVTANVVLNYAITRTANATDTRSIGTRFAVVADDKRIAYSRRIS